PKQPDRYYFLPYDASRRVLGISSINMTGMDLLKKFKDVPRVLVIADACHSGGYSRKPGVSKSVHDPLEVFKKSLKESKGIAIMSSSAPNEDSYEPPKLPNSLFTFFLLKGLNGAADNSPHDGIVTLHEAYKYASEGTRNYSRKIQNPVVEARLSSGSFPIAFLGKVDPKKVLVRRLFQLAHSGKTEDIRDLLRKTPSIVYGTNPLNNRTALMVAASKGHAGIVEELLNQGANTEAKDYWGKTALILASGAGHWKVVELLLRRDADAHAKSLAGYTALHAAARHDPKDAKRQDRYVRTAEVLIGNGAVVDARNTKTGSTPLRHAAHKGHLELVKTLLEHNADPNIADKNKRTPFSTACRYGRKEIVRILLNNGAHLKGMVTYGTPEDVQKTSSLLRAALLGDTDGIKALLKAGVDPDKGTDSGETPLIFASALGYTDVVKLLLDKGAEIDRATIDSKATPLMWASFNGRGPVVRLLVDKGAKVNAKNFQSYTSLMLAAEVGHTKIVKLLKEKGADMNAANHQGHTALTLASMKGFEPTVAYLLKNGADYEAKEEVKGREGSTPLILAARNGHTGIAKLLLNKGADINAKTEDLDSALTVAARNGDAKMVKLLLKRGADVNSTNRMGTALIPAAGRGHADVVRLLLGNGARPNAKDWEGFTARQVAERGNHKEVVEILDGLGLASKRRSQSD
ncbi:ankyrin repeat domain-containing protein, partial [Thermodesulfobacteriota bacterium]